MRGLTMRNHIYSSCSDSAQGSALRPQGPQPNEARGQLTEPVAPAADRRRRLGRRGAAGGALGLALGAALAAGGCATPATGGCQEGTTCVTLSLSSAGPTSDPGSPSVLDDLELIVRIGEVTRRVRFDDRIVRVPGELPLALPELATTPQQRVAVYLRAHLGPSGQAVGAVLLRAADQPLGSRYPLALAPACVAAPCTVPEPRRGATLSLVPGSRHLLLFGGRRQDGTALADTWEWDGLGWQSVTAASAPPARAGHTVALDGRRGTLLLFGGAGGPESAPQPLADTWEYQGESAGWRRLATNGPPARTQAAMASAAISAAGAPGVLLHGGLDASGNTLGDTWLWDGQGWSAPPLMSDPCAPVPPSPATLPRCRRQAALIAAPAGHALLVGGRLGPAGAAAPELDDQVWQWDGARWSPAPIYRPPTVLGRYGHAGVGAPGQAALVALGDSPGGLRQDSFLLDLGSGQFAPQLGPAPPPRAEAAVAYDEERDEVLLFGGRGDSALLGDTWSFTPAAGWRALK